MNKDFFAKRLGNIKPSATLVLAARAKEMQAEGKDVIGLSVGEPDFDTPDRIKTAAKKAMDEGKTKYPPVTGTLELRKAIIAKFERDNNLTYGMDQVIASTGGKQVIFNALMATVNPGDEVIIPAPYWLSYPEMTHLAEGKPVIINTLPENGFKLQPAELEKAITPKTKWLFLNSPSNPTGAAYTRKELAALGEVLKKHPHVAVFSDDIYEKLVYDGFEFSTIAEVCPFLYDRTLTMNGVSKSYAMTGWRIGYAGGPADLIKAMSVVQGQSTSGTSTISQAAAAEALNGDQSQVMEWQREFEARRNLVVSMINKIEGLSCAVPEGAFYVFVACGDALGKKTPEGKVIETAADLCDYFLNTHLVALVPGVEFGAPLYFRMSYALDRASLTKACERIQKACNDLTATVSARKMV